MTTQERIDRLKTELDFLQRMRQDSDDPDVKKLYANLVGLLANRIEVLEKLK